jgi:O-antigen/teichoic acid export membrane protein
MIHYKPAFSFKYIKEFCDFSFPNMRAGVGEYILMNLDRLLLVRYLSNTMLGFYNLAYELAEQFTTEVIYPLARGFFPVFSALENNKEKLKQTYLSSVSFLIPLCLAVGIGLSAIAEPLILIYAGDKWLQTIDLLNILALSAAAQAFCLVNATVLGATGRMKHRARLTTTNAIISTIIMLPFAINGDIMSVLMAKLGVTLGFVFINLWVVCQQLDITPKEIMSHFTRPIIAAIVMIITLNWINIHNPYWAFIVILMCGFISFIATQFTLWFLSGKPKTIEHTILQKVRFL